MAYTTQKTNRENLVFVMIEAGELEAIKKQLAEIEKAIQQKEEPEELMTLEEVSKLFHRTPVTIHAWKKAGLLPFYRISGKVYFKKHECLEALSKAGKGGKLK
jgi:hypothetical protein